ncbi:MAG: UDP-N-acetylmuramate dehydrogenase [Spirochaetaceae bacterium]|nr:UDP-N-acetylmuramate dehydrogenase [Spirochaetaceae bacterium]
MPTLRNFLEKININAAIAYEEPMSAHTTFRIGGPAEAFVSPRDREACLRLLREARAAGLPLFALGGGANILVGDRGIRGIVLDTSLLSAIRVEEGDPDAGAGPCPEAGPEAGRDGLQGGSLLVAEAGASVDALCETALERGLAGLENFYGMPGSLGGAVFMNARCYEVEMADRLAWVEAASPEAGANVERRPRSAGEWAYKRSPYQAGGPAAGALVLAAAFRLRPGERAEIEATMRGRRADREAKGHYRLPSAGSVFKNDRALGRPTGKILDELGFRGRRIGDAAVSDWHANIFVNAGKASAADMRALIECAQREVRERLGVGIEAEVVFAGDF